MHKCVFVALAALLLAVPVPAVAQDQSGEGAEQFIPITSYRTGPYAVGGIPFQDGFVDYLKMVNARDGGIEGVRIAWEECETAYKPDRFVECYERLKNRGERGASVFNPLGTPLTYAVIDRLPADKIPLITLGYGRTDASDGRVFPYVFPLMVNYWSQNTAKIRYIAGLEGGFENLDGLKIANVHHDSAYGKETAPVLAKQAERYGFEVQHFPVVHPGIDQKAVWLNVRRYRPDYVILRGWGVMNQTALKEAARVGVPADKIVGVWWSCAEQDTVPAGDAAVGYTCSTFHNNGTDFQLMQDIITYVHDAGDGTGPREAVGTGFYNRGVINAFVTVEAIRTAMGEFGARALSGEEVRWGIENMDLTDADIAAAGATNLVPPIHVSCADHEGGGKVLFVRWTGETFETASDWLEPDRDLVRGMIEESAAKYAAEKGITPRTCES
ncbi:MAG: ABC transporter substrate-binding protein [Rhodospirillales bacterium]|nr:ABC transporter substrate-binding protein [Rhodospirillales bacterium]